MPSMTCLILQAAARVTSSFASAAHRFAAVTRAAAAAAAARSDSGGAAASDPLKHSSSSVAAAGTARSPASSGSFHSPRRRLADEERWANLDTVTAVFHGAPFVQPDWAKFEANEKDLESDDALWDLYERWCKFFNQERDRGEMASRFSYFKETVLRVEENKKSDLPYRLGISKFADGKLAELYRNGKYIRPAADKGPRPGRPQGLKPRIHLQLIKA